jgi:hypothetical protein
LSIKPKVGDELMIFHRREAATNRLGKVVFSGIVPGLVYHVAEFVEQGNQQAAFRIPNNLYDKTLVLAPDQPQ